ncbi:putative quinol monooxygenase [Actinomycetospora flava]|uniref:Antibiotic biosynthesis monooxygenase n=1 Tax=Actinomycetospora flava TaxID=3129232 RepID=A0ABU8MBQ1_9PSEU
MSNSVESVEPVFLLSRFVATDEIAAGHLLADLRETSRAVTGEPGHLTYEVFLDHADPRALFVVESWVSGEDAERHERAVVTSGGVARVAPLLGEPISTRTLRRAVVTARGGARA